MASQSTLHTFVFEPPEEYICTVCSRVMTEPHLTDCCGQHFCLGCLERWYQSRGFKQCPHCRSIAFDHIVNLPLKRKINRLDVYCPNKEKGCQVATELGQLKAHLGKCDYTELMCTQGCQRKIFRKDTREHIKFICPKRIILCPYCHTHGCFDNISTQHRQVCQEYPVGCPQKCSEGGKQIKRKHLQDHKKICPLEPITCDFCNEMLLRQKMKAHKSNLCSKRPVPCPHCNMKGPCDALNSHLALCQEYPVGCPRGCGSGKQIKRKELLAHANSCPLEPVPCPLVGAGCSATIARKDLSSHMQSNTQFHLLCCIEMQRKQGALFDKRFSKLRAEHESLKSEHEKLKNEYQQMKASISAELAVPVAQCRSSIKTILSPNLTETNTLTFHLHQPRIGERNEQLLHWTSSPFTLNDQHKMFLQVDYNELSTSRSPFSAERQSAVSSVTMTLYLLKQNDSDAEFIKPICMLHDIGVMTYNSRNQLNDYATGCQSQSLNQATFQLCNICNSNLDMPEILQDAHSEKRVLGMVSCRVRLRDLSLMSIKLTLQKHTCPCI